MREAEEDDVVTGEALGARRFEHAVGERRQVRLEHAEALTGVGVRRDRADLHLGVGEKQAQHLSARVSTRSGDCRSYRHG
ncbi:hypothetical protein GA0115246_1082716 [Streptomyces sp. SolWspMP-sol7th]|nr:hypothetical protein GA0115246_1082716 [Streptomyces sp. SolWspMP-sol7th]